MYPNWISRHAIRWTLTEQPPALGDLVGGHIAQLLYDHYTIGGEVEIPDDPDDRAQLGSLLVHAVEAGLGGHVRRLDVEVGKRYEDLVFWDAEYGVGNVIGIEIDGGASLYNDTRLWALANLDDEWKRPGYRILPSIRLEDDASHDAMALRIKRGIGIYDRLPKRMRDEREMRFMAKRKYKLLKNGWNVGSLAMSMESYAEVAGYVLRAIGLQHRAADLKMMLVWTWS